MSINSAKETTNKAEKDAAPDFSVVICTYNGALRLPNLLERLQRQQASCCWEVLIVDNNSSDRTAAVVQSAQSSWRSTNWRSNECTDECTDVPLRYCFEPQQGLAYARRCAIRETKSELIGFLDDDTLPDDNWVEAAFQFSQQHPQVGAYGSSIRGLYETLPPSGFDRIACCLAIINRGKVPFQYSSDRGVLPAGAGMVIRRQAWLEQVPDVPALAGVKAGSLRAKGEDVETLSYIRRSWEIWHNPAMQLTHIIPSARLERDYLLNLFWHIGLSRYPLRKLQHRLWIWPLMVMLYCANDFRKGIAYLFSKYLSGQLSWRFLPSPANAFDTVEACEFSLLLGSFLSPFYRLIDWSFRMEDRSAPSILSRVIGQRLL